MKTLTVKQPWASLIVEGIKDIENRTWKTNFRGRVLIHASAKIAGSRLDLLNQEQFDVLVDKNDGGNYNCSSIIGSVEIVDCVINHESIWAEKTFIDRATESNPDTEDGRTVYNWVLANPIKFEFPIENVKGKLSIWEYDLKGIPSLK